MTRRGYAGDTKAQQRLLKVREGIQGTDAYKREVEKGVAAGAAANDERVKKEVEMQLTAVNYRMQVMQYACKWPWGIRRRFALIKSIIEDEEKQIDGDG